MYGSKRMCSINWKLITNCTNEIRSLNARSSARYPDRGSPVSGLGEPALRYRDSRQITETIAGSRAEPFRYVRSRRMGAFLGKGSRRKRYVHRNC